MSCSQLSTFDSQLAATAPIHDLAGNFTQAAKPNTPAANQVYVFDGWNRLTQVKETNGTVIATYEYDGRGNRIQKTTGATVRDYFHNDGGQVVEVRVNNILNQTFVWDLSYVDSPVMTRRDTASDGVLDQSYYFTFDALRNVTALINASNGNVLERYHYDSYGKVQVYNSTWVALSSSAYANIVTFTGRELDSESGLYYFRARYFDPSLGRFLARDPLGYVDGMNLYSGYFVPGGLDPSGLRMVLYFDPADGAPGPIVGQPVDNRDWIDHGADAGTGYNDVILFGANRWFLGADNSIDERSLAYKGGVIFGVGGSVALGWGGFSGARAGSGMFAYTQTFARGHLLFAKGYGTYNSTTNIVNGKGTAWDLLAYSDLFGYGLGKVF